MMLTLVSLTILVLVGPVVEASGSEGGVFVSVGESVCAGGYIMDWFCIKEGVLLDTGDETLAQPFEHSYHCLLDISQCINSPYEILHDPETSDSKYIRWYQASDNALLVKLGRQEGLKGYCSTCENTGSAAPSRGFRAEVKGTVTALASGDTPPILQIEQVRLLAAGTEPCLNPDEGEWLTADDLEGDDDDDDNAGGSTSGAVSKMDFMMPQVAATSFVLSLFSVLMMT
eukprot:CAMPEP_0168852026 /NCGR_PEP_ID=MMETSP0727-20121128/12746_1 /TAXON_ID=265536 /ORGANISM="Amphiprora sp., Strain CCMP467" /LENGTH=228 /DNA_ID=CAMNT_0008906099 /DNA_START=89 /DNA_END=775 /DNA_ORIENTATION=+